MSRSKLIEMLTHHEGRHSFVYKCPADHWTIGVGRNVDPDGGGYGLSAREVDFMLENDIEQHHKELAKAYSWYPELDEVRQEALIDMHFMGHTRFNKFKKMLAALAIEDYATASAEALNSKWAREDVQSDRSQDVVHMLLHGEYRKNAP